MPYTTPLRDLPRLPQPQGAIADAQGRPTPELFTYLTKLQAWAETVQAALDQLEPP